MVTYAESLDGVPAPPQTRRWRRFLRRHLPSVSVLLMAALLIATVLFPYVVITVPSGMVGVLWKRFNGYDMYCWCFVGRGTILEPRELREEGLHLVWPWDRLFQYNLRLQSATQTYNAISKDGVGVTVQINIRFQLLHDSIGVLHKFIGPQYLASVLSPEIGSQAREVISQYTAQEVYRSRGAIQDTIRLNSQKSLGAHLNALVQPQAMEQPDPKRYTDFLQNSIQILDTLVLSIELPVPIVAAINRQTEQYYQIQEFKFRVEREVEEAKRKQIEANGIAAFQRTVSQGISDSYLRWRGIEATLALAQSKNAKIVIIGSGKNGLPIILGNVDSPASPGPGPNPAEGNAPPGEKTPTTSPAPSGNAPAGTSSTTPAGGASTGAEQKTPAARLSTPQDTTQAASKATALEKKSTADSAAAPASLDKQSSSSIPLDLSDIKAILSRISEKLRLTGSATSSGTGAQPKQ
jgi:regulator of protease activity HflC (stomatin/prohibitin superfamily)